MSDISDTVNDLDVSFRNEISENLTSCVILLHNNARTYVTDTVETLKWYLHDNFIKLLKLALFKTDLTLNKLINSMVQAEWKNFLAVLF